MNHFDYTDQGRRPTVAQIVSAWKKAGEPRVFSVAYGETFAQFEYGGEHGWCRGWQDSGNGCRGVEREKVARALNAYHAKKNSPIDDWY